MLDFEQNDYNIMDCIYKGVVGGDGVGGRGVAIKI